MYARGIISLPVGHQGSGRARVDRDIHSGVFNDAQCVVDYFVQPDVPIYTGDTLHIQILRTDPKQEGYGIIQPSIAVNDNFSCHVTSLFPHDYT